MSVIDRLSTGLSRIDRRSFLTRAAVFGTALAVNPIDYILKPMSAYAAVCTCAGKGCTCGATCCAGYTDFCCTTSGRNTCPPGTSAAGWWKVDGSSFCGNGPRYYIDCNAHCGSCGCGASGLCAGSCSGTPCGCGANDCNNYHSGCTQFRYGQCNQQTRCLGPIVCRVVTCLPPWQIDGSCSTTSATDPATASHDAPCLHTLVGALDSAEQLPLGVRVTGWAVDQDTAGPVTVNLFVDGTQAQTVVASVPRPDIAAAFAGYGRAHGYDVTLTGVGKGVHQVCAYGVDPDLAGNAPLLGCLAVSVANPWGFVDSLGQVVGGVRATGWAIDPDTASPVSVQIEVDKVVAGSVVATNARPDVGHAYPGYGPNHGFDLTVPVPAGQHQVCVVAVNQGPGTNSQLGCVTLTQISNPFGYLDSAANAPGGVRVTGWAIDPDVVDPVTVKVTVDGVATASAPAGVARPDIANAYPAFGPNHGFDVTVPAAAGTRKVCVTAVNVGPGADTPLGCRTLTVGGNPVGFVDTADPATGGIRVTGWAVDPDTGDPLNVKVTVDGTVVATKAANVARPDIAAAFPGYGPNHGFDVTVTASPGSRQVCVIAVNVGAGTANPLLGCKTVTVT